MRFRTWPVAALGLAGLLGLIVVSLAIAHGRAVGTSGALDGVNTRHREIFTELRRVRSDVYLSAIYVRDYLLDNERARDPEYRDQLAEFRASSRAAVAALMSLLPADSEGREAVDRLNTSLDSYWANFEPLFYWTPTEKIERSADFVRDEVLHRREVVMGLAREIETINDASYNAQRGEIVKQRNEFQAGLRWLIWQSLVLGLIVSVVAVNKLRVLERKADEQRAFAEQAERRMRTLSQQIVATQEEERRKLSRELHDHVGQLLTGLRMSLGRIERVGMDGSGGRLSASVSDSKVIVDDLTRIVRDLASGLRPSMLDDLGLQPALEWLGRDVSRRSGLAVAFEFDGTFEGLPDGHATCAYRIVQEALTNVLRHAAARRADITVRRSRGALLISVSDDGSGFRTDQKSDGLGLRGIEERAKELAGSVVVSSALGRGTEVTVTLPLAQEEHHARLAG